MALGQSVEDWWNSSKGIVDENNIHLWPIFYGKLEKLRKQWRKVEVVRSTGLIFQITIRYSTRNSERSHLSPVLDTNNQVLSPTTLAANTTTISACGGQQEMQGVQAE